MSEPSETVALPASLRWLKTLVIVLTTVMIVGIVLLVGTMIVKLNTTAPPLPDAITLPNGTKATAFTQGDTWYAVVTTGNEILIFDRTTGALRQRVQVTD